ncbi:MAG: hypothetical protein U1E95_08780 [Rubrivivax sp.]
MADEFDDDLLTPPERPADIGTAPSAEAARQRLPELIAEFYRNATAPLRKRLVECLLRPVGPLGLVAVAAGAFGALLQRGSYRGVTVALDDAARISPEQVLELASYVEQVDPDTFLQLMPLLDKGTLGMAGVAASMLLLALQAWRLRRQRT